MVINIIKSVLFNLHFYILTFLLIIVMSPVLILPFWFIKIIAKIWGKILVFGMKIWLGLNLKIIGNYNKNKPCIIAVKHQSAWETVICTSIFDMPSIVLKKELIYLPIIGLYFLKGRAIPIIRENTIESLKKIVKMAKINLKKGSPILIFPQGTRVPLHASTKDYPYQSGIYFLYSQCNIPVIPVAHNAGLFWPKKVSIDFAKESFKFGLKGHLSNVLSFFNYRIDMFIIAYFMDDVAVGVYSVAVLLAERIWLISQSVSSVLFARVANLSNDDVRNRFTSIASRNTLFITLVGGLFLAVISKWFIELFFGMEFVDSVQPFLYMIPGVVIFSMSKVLANDFIGRGYPEINTYIAFVTALTNFGLNIWLIPIYGLKGAAIATSSSYILDALIKSVYFSFKNNVAFKEFYIFKSSDLGLYKTQINKYLKK